MGSREVKRYLIAVDAPPGTKFRVYREEPGLLAETDVAWVAEYHHMGIIEDLDNTQAHRPRLKGEVL